MSTIRAPGRTITVGPACQKLNPHLFPQVSQAPVTVDVSVPEAPKKRLRQDTKPLLNKLETEYRDRFLSKVTVPVTAQTVRLMLARGLWYKPDFIVWYQSLMPTAIEVKGPHAFRGGFENLKMAAQQYPWIKFLLVWKEGTEWLSQTVLA